MRAKSIEFENNGYYGITSVRIHLTYGRSSPIFEKEGCRKLNNQTITFDPNTPVRAVAAA